ncbi:MAG: HD-GYP domain-containing protein [Candidatus Dojkabacteria bacterium]
MNLAYELGPLEERLQESFCLDNDFESTKTFLEQLLLDFDGELYTLFESSLDDATKNHSINTAALTLNVYLRRKNIERVLSSLQDSKNPFLEDFDCERAMYFLDLVEELGPLKIVQSALYHDLGKSKNRTLFAYTGVFSREQEEEKKKHSIDSMDILKSMNVDDPLILGAVYNHHRRSDGTGYPELNIEIPPSEFDFFLGLVDCFETMISSVRGYKSSIDIKDALKKLRDEIESNKANPVFQKHLFLVLLCSLRRTDSL